MPRTGGFFNEKEYSKAYVDYLQITYPDRKNKWQRDWLRKNPAKRRAYNLNARFGIPLEEYDELFEKQRGRCAICNKKETQHEKNKSKCSLGVDHCHKTNKIRGLLCHRCNKGLGLFKDNSQYLQKAITYVNKFK